MKTIADDLLNVPHGYHGNVIAEALGVDVAEGLSVEEADERLKRGSANRLAETKEKPWWRVLLAQFSSIVVWLLLAAAFIAWATGGLLEAAAILAVLALNALIGFVIEWQAGRALEALRRETHTTARVRRDGREIVIDAEKLVIGDIISLTAGDRVPADARLLESINLRTDESTLTGESVPVEKSVEAVDFASILAERHSMLYLGTMVVAGHATAIITATGSFTEIGRIGQLIAKTKDEQTPLERKLAGLGKILVYIVIGIALVIMSAGFLRGDELLLMLKVSISLAVAAVPEGLPAMTTLILALGVLRMARRFAIVRKLSAVETLGSTTVVCTDKTGTLTENRMTVQEFHLANDRLIDVSEDFSAASAAFEDENFRRILRAGVLCSEASFDSREEEAEKRAIGDPTETALLLAADRFGLSVSGERAKYEIVSEQPFEAATKRMIAVLRDKSGGESFAVMKGAPAVVLDACANFAGENNADLPLADEKRRYFYDLNEKMASRALRVLAFAEKPLAAENAGETESGYTFLGFAGMSDPPREGVAEAITGAHRAGIRVVMLTGDQIETARAIAAELNLSENGDVFALHGQDVSNAKEENLAALARKAHVFARVSPEDKLRIVEALQKAGEIVAVTGDGINDAPALKRADIGIAMGMRGTEVAKEASDVILTDDNFSTIIKAVEGGRTIYSNIIKFVNLLFAANLSEVLVIFVAILFGLPLPLLPLQILWINLVTDVFPAFALAVEPPAGETMRRRPRPPGESLLSPSFLTLIGLQGAMLAAIALSAYLWALSVYGEGAHARTIALLALVAVQLGHLLNCRSRTRSAFDGFFRNPFIFIAFAIVLSLQFLAVTFAPLMRVLETVQLAATDLIVVLLCLILPVLIVEAAKYFARRNRREL
jgi:Ca2+-transporting ATPase